MQDIQQAVDRILLLAQRVPGLAPASFAEAVAEVRAVEATLQAGATYLLGRPPVAEETDLGAQLAQAAIDIGPAGKALATALQWSSRTPAPEVLAQVIALNLRLAQTSLLRALRPLSKVSPLGHWPDIPDAVPPASAAEAMTLPDAAAMDLGVQRNIATYHREHERFYALDITESAVDLYREANKLRMVAAVWLSGEGRVPRTDIDFTLPQYQAAGCEDLNALQAIAAIGVLFMEGEAEPSEIRTMKAKLQALAGVWSHVGQWLSDKMDAAWLREQATCTPALIGLAQARFNTIATNWRGAREMALSGQLLTLALAALQTIDFNPAALRADRAAAGRQLLEVAWIVALSAQVRARSAADLAENDRNWTTYLDSLPTTP